MATKLEPQHPMPFCFTLETRGKKNQFIVIAPSSALAWIKNTCKIPIFVKYISLKSIPIRLDRVQKEKSSLKKFTLQMWIWTYNKRDFLTFGRKIYLHRLKCRQPINDSFFYIMYSCPHLAVSPSVGLF